MRRDAYLQHLAEVPLFRACSKKELAAIARHADEVEIGAGTTLVNEGDRGHEFFVIVDGTAKVTRGKRNVATLGAGDFFGELALLDPAPRNASVVAETPMRVLVLEQRDFSSVLWESPNLSAKVLAGIARRLREVESKKIS